jgi:hypothetical protein
VTARAERLSILVAGMLAGVPGQGGASWAVLQYLLGLRRLGHDVTFVEEAGGDGDGAVGHYFRQVVAGFGLDGSAALLLAGGRTIGLPRARVREAARRADVVLNLSGSLRDDELLGHAPARVYVDLDPAFTQLWQAAEGIDVGLDRHNRFVTVGLKLGDADCPVPACGRHWTPTLPPVFLPLWPAAGGRPRLVTTVANFRGYGSIEWRGTSFGQKAHSLRALRPLPRRTDSALLLALAIHPDERSDLAALREWGWDLVDPAAVAATPWHYAEFVRGSAAELGVAKSGYVASRCGWFSDRSACYLASGRPVVAQDTGFGAALPIGRGLLAFSDVDSAADALARVEADWHAHARAARRIAEEHLDSDRVLPKLLDAVTA